MKKIVMTLALAMGTMGFVSCSDDNDEDALTCDQLLQIIVDARIEYDQTTGDNQDCLDLRAALQDYLDESCGTAEQRADIEAELEALNCDDI